MESDHKTIIYKNDLKFLSKIDIENQILESDFYNSYTKSDSNEITFDSDQTESLYNTFKDKNKIELRIQCCINESYNYFDLSSLYMTDNQLRKLFKIKKIRDILEKIELLDISNNNLNVFPEISEYKNIININISHNYIKGEIITENYDEICCKDNEITSIISNRLKKLEANNNKIKNINIPNIEVLHINNNKLSEIGSYNNLVYLECIENKIIEISNMEKLEELFISNNKLENLYNMDNLQILNCIENPIKKIHYFPKLTMMIISTKNISKQYKIETVKKIKEDFFIKLVE